MDKFIVVKQIILLVGIMAVLVIPNRCPKYIKVGALVFYLFLIFFVYSAPSFAKSGTTTIKTNPHYPAKTALSKKALHLKLLMTPKQVIKLLGTPTWVRHEKGIPLAWIWKNGRCDPVYVTFDKHKLVNSYDEGRAICYSRTFTPLPSRNERCSIQKNRTRCRP